MDNDIIFQDIKRIYDRVDLNPLCGTTILITGSSGLIGTYILACLCHLRKRSKNMKVYAHHLSELPSHVEEIVSEGRFITFRANLADFDAYKHIPEVDVIIHAAGYAQPSLFMANPVATIQINTAATVALLSRLSKNGKFLFVSSSEVYNGLNKSILKENDIGLTSPFHFRAPYIEGKRCGEAICNAFSTRGVEVKSARVALAYGPGTRKHDKRALNSFIEKALCKRKIELLDAGTAVRTYCYVADIVELLWQILLYGNQPIYNVGGRSTVTIANLARIIADMTDAKVIAERELSPLEDELVKRSKQILTEVDKSERVAETTSLLGVQISW